MVTESLGQREKHATQRGIDAVPFKSILAIMVAGKKSSRFVTCLYTGDLRRDIHGRTGHARLADTADGTAVAGLWAFQLGGEGEIHRVRVVDLSFLRAKRRKVAG